jgi:tRNA nucleotidyltransferase (CCA-adding enzyme)
VPAIVRLNDFNLLQVIHPSIKLDKLLINRLNSVKKVVSWYDLLFLSETYRRWAVYFLVLICHGNKNTAAEACDRFELPLRLRKSFTEDRLKAEDTLYWLERHAPIDNANLYRRLDGFKTEMILYMMAVTRQETVKKAISLYFTTLRHRKPTLTGQDLIDMGLRPGPVFKQVLQAVLDAKLNGKIKTPEDELEFARAYAHSH